MNTYRPLSLKSSMINGVYRKLMKNKSDFGRESVLKAIFLSFSVLIAATITTFFVVIAPGLALLLVRYVLLILVAVFLYRLAAPLAPLWVRALFCVVLGQAILGYGFSNIAIGIGPARVTVSELVLALSLAGVAISQWPALFTAGAPGFVLLTYISLPLVLHFVPDVIKYGVIAARDALPIICTFFFFGGSAVVGTAISPEQWKNWKQRLVFLLVSGTLIYLLLYPAQSFLISHSPRAYGYQLSAPILGYFTTTNAMALAGLLAIVLVADFLSFRPGAKIKAWLLKVSFIVFAFGVVMLQSRATYVAATASIIILALNGHKKGLYGTIFAIFIMASSIAAIEFSGIEMKGRVGQISLSTLSDQVSSISRGDQKGVGSGGTQLRLRWWRDSLERWSDSPGSMLVGIGFGEALTSFTNGSRNASGAVAIVREPHNSYISILTRTGMLGLLPWLVFQFYLMVAVWRKFRSMKNSGALEADYWLWLFLLFMNFQILALVEPVFESPFFAGPYFFLAGTALAEIARDEIRWRKKTKSYSSKVLYDEEDCKNTRLVS